VDALTMALRYAKRSMRVLPIHGNDGGRCGCGDGRCPSPCKHPVGSLAPHGLKDATTDEQTIRQWFALHPDANVGVATGWDSGVVVLDVDDAKGGSDTLANLQAKHGPLPDSWTVRTGGGRHIYFDHPGDAVKSCAGALGPGLDMRGDGAYAVAPPSVHATGAIYEWERTPKDGPLAALPFWLTVRPARSFGGNGSRKIGRTIPLGQRNTDLASVAGTLRRLGGTAGQMFPLILALNARCDPPLSEDEVARICESIERYPPDAVPVL
jgi:hypothetical protein